MSAAQTGSVLGRTEVLRRAQMAMSEHRLDALVAQSNASTFYMAGTSFLVQRIGGARLGIVVTFADGEQIFIYERTEAQHAKTESWIPALREYVEAVEHPIEVLADVLRERGVDRGRIGVEMLFMSTNEYELLRQACPTATIVDAEPIFQRLRAVKTPEELAHLQAVALTTVRAIRKALESLKIGDSEIEIAERMKAAALDLGISQCSHLVLASGANALKTRHEPDGTKVAASTILRVDFGLVSRHYPSDIARTAILAPPFSHQLEAYKKLEEIFHAVVDAIHPGVSAGDIYRAFAKACERAGVRSAAGHVGHSISINLENRHESPVLQPLDTTVLEPGMALAVAPVILGVDARYQVEDLVEVTRTGARVLSRSDDWNLTQPLVFG